LLLSLTLAACATGRLAGPPSTWLLVQPPEVRDADAPRGYRLLPRAPIGEWREQGAFATEAECLQARKDEVNRTIDTARAAYGEPEAKFDLTVRRAVNARCVEAETVRGSAAAP
jgi:hypothetical protein